MVGKCGLCHEGRELRDSHLLPAAVYKLARESNRRNPNPIIVTPDRASSSSKQVSDMFLCGECEGRFSRGGERYVLSQCTRQGGGFALRELLRASPPFLRDSRFTVYEVGSLLYARTEQYLYFAASVFWRASARSWTYDGRQMERLSLGPYEEQLRLYLLGVAAFPSSARLFVHVWSDARIDFTTVAPTASRADGVRRYKFCIPGILFILFVGKETPQRQDQGALNSSQGQFMWLCPWKSDSLFEGFGRLAMGAIKANRTRTRRNIRAV